MYAKLQLYIQHNDYNFVSKIKQKIIKSYVYTAFRNQIVFMFL